MLKYNILVKISGSIAAYKSASLISRLVQNNYNVKVVVTKDALQFIGKATLEGLSGNKVYDNSFEDGNMMSHINLVKWADLTIIAPATANTINKLANGIGDNLLTSLFLAHDFSKPYLIAPAMNTNMLEHPSTSASIHKLSSWGVEILSSSFGYLACGDTGPGKLMEPDEIFNRIENRLKGKKSNVSKKVLITAGGTRESIDGIRYLTNLSTGSTASAIAQFFIDNGYFVVYLHSSEAKLPNGQFEDFTFTDFKSLNSSVKNLLKKDSFGLVIHNAAVSDYSVKEIISDNAKFKIPLKQKLDSSSSEISIKLKSNFKIVNKIKGYSKNKSLKLVSFKFTNSSSAKEIDSRVIQLLKESNSDLVIQNDLSSRENNVQKGFNFYDKKGLIKSDNYAADLGIGISQLLKI